MSLQPVSHLKRKDADDGFVVADAVLHVAGVHFLRDLQGVLFLLNLSLPLGVLTGLLYVLLLRRCFGSDPPQNPVGPGGFPLLTTEETQIK